MSHLSSEYINFFLQFWTIYQKIAALFYKELINFADFLLQNISCKYAFSELS
jgi:hypothetical protein